jgi:GT2 family glycosyltransferase
VTPELAAVIVNSNAGAELRAALQSIADEMAGRAWEAVVVDNASVDGSADITAEFAAHARVVRNATNVGFGRGINQGVAASSAPLVLIMNPDCRPEARRRKMMSASSRHSNARLRPRVPI